MITQDTVMKIRHMLNTCKLCSATGWIGLKRCQCHYEAKRLRDGRDVFVEDGSTVYKGTRTRSGAAAELYRTQALASLSRISAKVITKRLVHVPPIGESKVGVNKWDTCDPLVETMPDPSPSQSS